MSSIEITLPPPIPKCANGPCIKKLGDGKFELVRINKTELLLCEECSAQLQADLAGPKNKLTVEALEV